MKLNLPVVSLNPNRIITRIGSDSQPMMHQRVGVEQGSRPVPLRPARAVTLAARLEDVLRVPSTRA